MQRFAGLACRRAIATQLADHQARGLQDVRRVQCQGERQAGLLGPEALLEIQDRQRLDRHGIPPSCETAGGAVGHVGPGLDSLTREVGSIHRA